jgi:hypothetical protein
VTASIEAAVRARADAAGRLAEARDVIAVQSERARSERKTIIAALRQMREANNLSRLIMDTVERDTGASDDAGASGG